MQARKPMRNLMKVGKGFGVSVAVVVAFPFVLMTAVWLAPAALMAGAGLALFAANMADGS